MDRLISEQAVLNAICKSCSVESKPNKCQYKKGLNGGCLEYETVKAIPSAEPKTAHWIVHPKGIYAHLICDNCLSNAPYDCRTNYCPNCGFRMVEPQERSE